MTCCKSLFLRACIAGLLFSGLGLQAVNAQNQTGKSSPKPDDRRTPSEKLAAKRFDFRRKVYQNLVTRYNYYFNAKMKLENTLKGIQQQRQENFNVYLPFYPYTIESLNLNQAELDSVILKGSLAVQLHDPRGKWIDDCYLLIGKAYYYKSDWENATATFRFINTAFAPKKKKEKDLETIVGKQEDSRLTISSKEKKGFWGRFKHKYARNDAFMWQVRTFLEEEKYDEAQALLNVLEADPNFPSRLTPAMNEIKAYGLYKREMYAESVNPLKIAIEGSRSKEQKARMSYILGQIYLSQRKADSSIAYFQDVIRLKPDPMMDFHARLEIARANIQASGGTMEESIAALQHMLRKENFIPYRDVIYYTMGSIAATSDPEAGKAFLQKGLNVESTNLLQRTLTFKAMADINYKQRNYLDARRWYDSTAAIMPPEFTDANDVNARKNVLGDIAAKIAIIRAEDSLQQIAALPEAQRNLVLEKKIRDMQRQAAAKVQEEKMQNSRNNAANTPFNPAMNRYNTNQNLPGQEAASDWYFYNMASKASGYSEFRRRWGNRKPVDNWRRSQQSGTQETVLTPIPIDSANATEGELAAAAIDRLPADSLTADILSKALPLTEAKMQDSRNRQMDAWYDLGKMYHDQLDNYPDAIATYDTLLMRFPNHPRRAEVAYSLYVWNNKINRANAASPYKNIVLNEFPTTNFAGLIRSGGAINDASSETKKAAAAIYGEAYTAFKEGKYEETMAKKRLADSLYPFNYLQPRFDLLAAMTKVRTGTDEEGKAAIQEVITKYPADDRILGQANDIMAALTRKNEIVGYLSNLQTTVTKDSTGKIDENISIRYPWQTPQPNLIDSVAIKKRMADSLAAVVKNIPPPPPPKPVTPYKLTDEKSATATPHFVVMSFKRVDKTLLDEALTQFAKYNADKHAADKIEASSFVLTPTELMLIFRLFPGEEQAFKYYDEVRKEASLSIVPRIRPTEYTFFIISRENFILLNSTKDLEGYAKFFRESYYTE
ncbi:tetratricopeptide repeat protein [uncultured Chitinophaga sp.]|uniref:type IX secretion system periplasmic lipoprotein PorW/SprE n=1 Tax=uncultured Chitinophaga sp. TaxID=339340 RepID=UPI0025CDFB70|nr:tetratricopeptide repeat protein [uncultured Chitinophaga sp.]